MKTKLVNRYYCDFCNKSKGTSGSMKRHESGCTKNPNRICGLCAAAGELQTPIAELITAAEVDAKRYGEDAVIPRELEHVANGCPACILAAIRQCGFDPSIWDFNYAEASAAFWQQINADRDQECLHG